MSRWTIARGCALFLGGFALANAVGLLCGGIGQDAWWLDLWFLDRAFAVVLSTLGGVALVSFGVRPPTSSRSLVAFYNVVGFYTAWAGGAIVPGVPVPLSIVVLAALVLVAWLAALDEPPAASRRSTAAVGVMVAILIGLFPLAQVAFFGTTSYARPAQAAVVLGARVHDNGMLSQSLRERVNCAVSLYRSGKVSLLVMSGGVGDNGVDEAQAMAAHAIAAGVPAEAIVLDGAGVDTDSTVRNTSQLLRDRGISRVVVVSQFYHLPRIKLAYGAVGMNVYTVPAPSERPIPKTPLFVAREVPGFWVYWLRALGRDVGLLGTA